VAFKQKTPKARVCYRAVSRRVSVQFHSPNKIERQERIGADNEARFTKKLWKEYEGNDMGLVCLNLRRDAAKTAIY
jgi:hypothetical protein